MKAFFLGDKRGSVWLLRLARANVGACPNNPLWLMPSGTRRRNISDNRRLAHRETEPS